MTELWQIGASKLAAEIRERHVSSREVVEAHLRRIDAVNSSLNAISVVLADHALQAADTADKRIAAGETGGPLNGVPFTVKENIDVAGTATTSGVKGNEGKIAPLDAPAVAHLTAAGGIVLGRTNCPDFAFRWDTESGLYGRTLNPWHPEHTPGGSSGGEATALATGMSPLGVGTDFGGSLRWPAQCCGVLALRSTLGRIAQAGSLEPVNPWLTRAMMSVNGPLARHTEDLRLAFEVMSRPSARDPWYVPAPLTGDPVSKPVRVAVVSRPAGLELHPTVAVSVRTAADALSDAGYEVEEAEPPDIAGAAALWGQLVLTDMRGVWPQMETVAGAGVKGFVANLFAVIPPVDLAGYAGGFAARNGIAREWNIFQEKYPVILGPICTQPTFRVGEDLEGAARVSEMYESFSLKVAINVLGLPSTAVPVQIVDRLPYGIQVIGARYREDLCLEAAATIESRLSVFTPIDPLDVAAGSRIDGRS